MIDLTQLRQQAQKELGCQIPALVSRGGRFADWSVLAQVLAPMLQQRKAQIVAVNGSQGSGKSTFAGMLAEKVTAIGGRVQVCSIDDFYLPSAQRQELARSVHPLLATRGVPGTHDIAWLGKIIDDLVASNQTRFSIPQFDKGLDERVGEVDCEADIIIVEGWCVGIQAQPAPLLAKPCNRLEAQEDANGLWRQWVNQRIQNDYEKIWPQVDFWVHLRVPSFEQVFVWRQQQEQQLPAAQRMDDASLSRFIEHYERLTRWLWASPMQAPNAVVQLDTDHRVSTIGFDGENKR